MSIDQLEPVATIRAFKHLHSTNTAPQDTSFPPVVINTRRRLRGALQPPRPA